jgi:hypothetical protein
MNSEADRRDDNCKTLLHVLQGCGSANPDPAFFLIADPNPVPNQGFS